MKKLIAANWKMNKTVAEAIFSIRELKKLLKDVKNAEVAICPPFTALKAVGEELKKSSIKLGAQNMQQIMKLVSLKVIDTLWQDHLSNMEHMRDSVRLRAYGGHDPLVEYKNEGRKLFSQLLEEIDLTIGNNILKAGLQVNQPAHQVLAVKNNDEVGRNDLCPCGSGKKYKRCHGKTD